MREELRELNQIFISLSEAKRLNLSDFPYTESRNKFNFKLKECLKEIFGSEIEFDREETFAYIQAHYKGVGIEINTFDGIILTIEDKNAESLASDFKDCFDKIVGKEAICSYDFCSSETGKFTVYPTVEWSLDPERRLYELIVLKNYPGIVKSLEDYYTCSIIQSLGQELFTIDGYQKLFPAGYENIAYRLHKRRQIQKLNPNISDNAIYDWVSSAKKTIELSEDVAYQKAYIDDGK